MKQTTVINLFGGACVGKSTQAALLFAHLKCLGHSCELVNEYVKEHIWAERKDVLRSDKDIKQDYIFAKQHKKQYILEGKVDYIITDSPISKFSVILNHFWPQDTPHHLKQNLIPVEHTQILHQMNLLSTGSMTVEW